MRINGSYIYDAPRDLVWSLLHDSDTIRQAVPGCDHFHLHADGKYHISLTLPAGPFGGYYEGIVTRLGEEQPQECINLSITGSGPETVFFGEGTLSLEEDQDQTRLLYEGDVDVSGQIPSHSPRLTRTTANYLIRSFLEGLDRQIHQITGAAGSNGLPPGETAVDERTTPTIGVQEFLAELRRDRWIAAAVFLLGLLAILSVLGAVFLGLLTLRWLARSFASRASQPEDDQQSTELPLHEA